MKKVNIPNKTINIKAVHKDLKKIKFIVRNNKIEKKSLKKI